MKVYIGPFPSDKTMRKRPNAQRKVQVRIDKTDTWDLFTTLAHVIHPALVAFKAETKSAAMVAAEDAPAELTGEPDGYGSDTKVFERWNWVLDEMIWAFERLIEQDEHLYIYEPYAPGEIPEKTTAQVIQANGVLKDFEMITQDERMRIGKYNRQKATEYQARMDNAFKLFGKYYQNLWS